MGIRAVSLPVIPSQVLPDTYTVDTLPDPALYVDKYARVTDLFGGKRDLVLASQDATGAYWQPVRPAYKGNMNITADTALTALKHPSILTLTGNVGLGVTRTITLSNQLVFPGAQFTVRAKLTTLLGSLKVLDSVSSLLTGLLLNTSNTYVYDPNNGWEQI
jgi:hypothetical protein